VDKREYPMVKNKMKTLEQNQKFKNNTDFWIHASPYKGNSYKK